MYAVVLHKKTEDDADEYFTPHNEIVGRNRGGVWTRFEDAHKAALRAKLQDPLHRKVTVQEI